MKKDEGEKEEEEEELLNRRLSHQRLWCGHSEEFVRFHQLKWGHFSVLPQTILLEEE